MEFLTEMEKSAFFFDGALVVSGSRNPAWGVTDSFTLIELPDADAPGAWSRKYENRLDSAHIEAARYEMIRNGLKNAKSHAIRNRYTLNIYEQTGRLLNYPMQLLIALENYDKAKTEEERAKILQQIKELCSYFREMRAQLESVYSQTRFMSNPAGYITDQNQYHHLSALTNNSDWMYLYELPMIEKIESWIDNLDKKHE